MTKAGSLAGGTLSAVISVVFLVLAGCGSSTQLQPAPTAETVSSLADAAVDSVGGVKIIAQADAWPGDPAVEQAVLPLKVRIQNGGDSTLLVEYEDFALVDPAGAHFAAVPPFEIGGTIQEPLASVVGPISPEFGYDEDFMLAPYYTGIYPDMSVWGGPWGWNPYYYQSYYNYWANVSLPTPEMLRRALPEGVLKPGGMLDGFIYFEKPGKHVPRLTFRADLKDVSNGRIFGTISIPFVVTSS